MSAIPSSDDAIDGYSNLEEYIFNTERDHDREVRTTLRLWEWQEVEIRILHNSMGTNAREVSIRAFSMGLKVLRERLEADIEKMTKMSVNVTRNILNLDDDLIGKSEFRGKIVDAGFELDCSNGWNIGDPEGLVFRDSEYSEVQSTFVDGFFFGPWIKRAIIALGLAEAKSVSNQARKYSSEIIEEMGDKSKDSLELMEKAARVFIASNFHTWKQEGITRTDYRRLEEIVALMQTEHGDYCESVLDDLEGAIK